MSISKRIEFILAFIIFLSFCALFFKDVQANDAFKASLKDLQRRIDVLIKDYPDIKKPGIVKAVRKDLNRDLSQEKILIVIECKKLLLNFMSEGEMASWGEIGVYLKLLKNHNLETIHQLSLIQSESLDKALLESMISEHQINNSKATKLRKRAVIVGGGSSGLYSALKLFLAGMQVTLINDRENYVRTHIVSLGNDWIFQLQILLGTRFDYWFSQDKGQTKKGREINLNLFESALKERLETLIEYINDDRHLELLFGVSVETIRFPSKSDSNYYAVLSTEKLISFDILVCAAGVSDKIRNTYLGIPKQRTVPENCATAVLIKGDQLKNKKLVSGETYSRMLRCFVKEQNFEHDVKESPFLSEVTKQNFAEKADTIGKKISGLYAHENISSIYFSSVTDPVLAEVLQEAERKKTKTTDQETLKLIQSFKKTIERKWLTAVANLVINGDKRTSKHIPIDIEEVDDAKKLTFDPVNSSSFEYSMFSLDKAAVDYKVLGNSAIVMAVGDSAVTAHYFTGTGSTVLRISVEKAVKQIKNYNHGIIEDTNILVRNLNENLVKLKLEVSKTATDPNFTNHNEQLVEFNTPEMINKIAVEKMCSVVNEADKQDNQQVKFVVESVGKVSADNPDFKIIVEGNAHPARVTNNGQVQVGEQSNNTFSTLMQAVMALKKE